MTPEQREELKPCPFCGGAVTLEKGTRDSNMGPRNWWGVKCRNTMNLGGTCAIEQIPSGSPEAAIERWNRRAQVEALTAGLDKIIEMNRFTAEHQYGNAEKAESWSCVKVARDALNGIHPAIPAAPQPQEQS